MEEERQEPQTPREDEASTEQEPAAEVTAPATDWEALAAERWDTILRLRADFENYRRRVDREREDLRALVAEDLLLRFLPVYDNLDRALKAIPDEESTRAFRKGLEMTRRSFLELLRQEGVEPVPTVGTAFDPSMHEAIARVASDAPDGTVLDEVQAGFRRRDRVIRAALVRVSSGPEAAADEEPTAAEKEAEARQEVDAGGPA
jgi:molecular chaperone GrpE